MAKKTIRKRRKNDFITAIKILLSIAAGGLFTFGIIEYFKSEGINPLWLIITGATLMLVLVIFHLITTENSVAMKRR